MTPAEVLEITPGVRDTMSAHPRVAFQGERGAYGDLAIQAIWGDTARPLASWSFDDVIAAVVSGRCDYGVLPIENTIVGEIHVVRTALQAAPTLVVATDIVVPIRHAILAPPGATLATLHTVTSHPVAIAQCRNFLRRHPAITPYDSYDTAGAARDVSARGRTDEGAIAGIMAAERYHLVVLAEDIQDVPDNQTRFVVVARTGQHS